MTNFQKKLAEHRSAIDRLDAILVYTLGERFEQTKNIGKLKAEEKIGASDNNRELAQIKRLKKLCVDAKLKPEFAEKLLKLILSEVKKNHERIKSSRY